MLDRRRGRTCDQSDLGSVGFQVVGFVRESVYLTKTAWHYGDLTLSESFVDVWQCLKAAAEGCAVLPWETAAAAPNTIDNSHTVISQAAQEHLSEFPGHVLATAGRVTEPTFLLDSPLPHLLDVRPRRCETCTRSGCGCVPLFQATAEDVLRCLPQAVAHRTEPSAKSKRVRYMTGGFLLTLLQSLHEHLNLRAVRQELFSFMSVEVRSQILAGRSEFRSPTNIGALALALPTPGELRLIALKAFSRFAARQVDIMVQRQCIFNFSIVRGDGHYDIASRVFELDDAGKRSYLYTCLLAWCGTDGSLLKPFVLMPGESFEDQVQDLRPFLQRAKEIRMTFGMSTKDSRPTVRATDTYNKHRRLWPRVYDGIWLEQCWPKEPRLRET